MEYTSVILHIACLLLVAQSGESIKCYKCDSTFNPSCGNPFNSEKSMQPEECTPDMLKTLSQSISSFTSGLSSFGFDTTTFTKNIGWDSSLDAAQDISKAVCQKVEIIAKNKTLVVRGCSLPKSDVVDTCKGYQKPFENAKDVQFSCDFCDSDGCNGASGVAAGSLLVAVLAALCLAMFKY